MARIVRGETLSGEAQQVHRGGARGGVSNWRIVLLTSSQRAGAGRLRVYVDRAEVIMTESFVVLGLGAAGTLHLWAC